MVVVVDTALVWGYYARRDRRFGEARRLVGQIATGRWGAAVTNDYVYAEAMALASRAGPGGPATIDDFFFGPDALVRLVRVDARAFDEARARMLAARGRALSLADWTLVVLAERVRAKGIATFDAELAAAYGATLE